MLETGLDDTFFTIAEEVDNLAGPKMLNTSQSIATQGSIFLTEEWQHYLRGSPYPLGGSPTSAYAQSFSMPPLPVRASMGFGPRSSSPSGILTPAGNSGHSVAPSLETIRSGRALNSPGKYAPPMSHVNTYINALGVEHKSPGYDVSPFLTGGISYAHPGLRGSQAATSAAHKASSCRTTTGTHGGVDGGDQTSVASQSPQPHSNGSMVIECNIREACGASGAQDASHAISIPGPRSDVYVDTMSDVSSDRTGGVARNKTEDVVSQPEFLKISLNP